MSTQDELEILIDENEPPAGGKKDDPPAKATTTDDGNTLAVEPEKKSAIRSGDEGIDDLQKRLADSQKRADEANARAANEAQRRAAAEHEAQRATQYAQHFQSEAQASRYERVTNSVESAEKALKDAKNALKAATNAGDVDGMAEAQAEIAIQAANRAQATRDKEIIEDEIEDAKRRPKQQQRPEPQRSGDPVGDYIETLQVSSTAKGWLRQHPECLTDPKKNARMTAAHNLAVADDVAIDSPEYYERIETAMGYRQAEEEAETRQTQTRQPGKRPPAAPVSRDIIGGDGSVRRENGKIIVKLSAEEREMAALTGMSDAEYAKHKYNLSKEGRLGPGAVATR